MVLDLMQVEHIICSEARTCSQLRKEIILSSSECDDYYDVKKPWEPLWKIKRDYKMISVPEEKAPGENRNATQSILILLLT